MNFLSWKFIALFVFLRRPVSLVLPTLNKQYKARAASPFWDMTCEGGVARVPWRMHFRRDITREKWASRDNLDDNLRPSIGHARRFVVVERYRYVDGHFGRLFERPSLKTRLHRTGEATVSFPPARYRERRNDKSGYDRNNGTCRHQAPFYFRANDEVLPPVARRLRAGM